ncbi:hypothetical protein KSP39_PZI012819 [Platanthera zijinensis]|uniref:Uncharacterized protein n=1 Tax=Platanthera zijinensis TaxID=2320716 RepID=A0AAP0BE06_9ASPA
MATLSISTQHPTPHLYRHNHYHHHRCFRRCGAFPAKPGCHLPSHISAATRIPSTPPTIPPGGLYQPFRPPSSPLPAMYSSLGPEERLEILRNRFGLWHEYAPLISSLSRDGFTPASIEEITGITGVEQNLLAVASKVRDSLISSSFPMDILAFFNAASGADLLYALRLLNSNQRAAAAAYFVEYRIDSKELAEELARAIKDFPRRRGEEGWECFSADSPRDCLAYTDFRLSREVIPEGDRVSVLEKALEAAETERARKRIMEEIHNRKKAGEGKVEEEMIVLSAVPVVKLRYGEVSEATSVVLLPVCRASEGNVELEAAPVKCIWEGQFGVVTADRGWERWVVLPGWGPAVAVSQNGGVAVEFGDGRVLPWREYRWGKEETVLVVVDRKRREVEEDGFYLVQGGNGEGLLVERGRKVLESGRTEALGAVVLVVRPPMEENGDQLGDEDWE